MDMGGDQGGIAGFLLLQHNVEVYGADFFVYGLRYAVKTILLVVVGIGMMMMECKRDLQQQEQCRGDEQKFACRQTTSHNYTSVGWRKVHLHQMGKYI